MLKFQSEKLNERFKKSRLFGMGTYASSERVWCNKTCRLFFLKTFPRALDEEIDREVQNGIKKNFSMRHSNIVTYYEAFNGLLLGELAFTT